MKLKNILLTGLALSALTACNDFLDVDAPSKQTNESIFTKPSEINTALNNIYVQALSGDTYGNSFYGGMMLNSDVDFTSNVSENATGNAIQRFDVNVNNSTVSKAWKQLYKGIETANNFIYNLEKSEIYQKGDEDIVQMMGEAKVLRSMFYYDLIWYFGDVPFTFTPSIETNNYVIPVTDREEIQKSLIADLLEIAPRMKSTTECTVERASREAAYAMIARIALQAGGYSLHPDKSNAKNYGTMSRPSNYQEYYLNINFGMFFTVALITFGVMVIATYLSKCRYIIPWALIAGAVAVSVTVAANYPSAEIIPATSYASDKNAWIAANISYVFFAIGIGVFDFIVVKWLCRGDKLGLSGITIDRKITLVVACALFVIATVVIGYFSSLKYRSYSNFAFDFGIFAQMYERMAVSGAPETTLERSYLMSHFGVHFSPIFYIFLPGYWIFRSPYT